MEASEKRESRPAKRTRRRFTPQFKTSLVELACAPGASVAQVAMEHQINANQLRRWITQAELGNAVQPMVPVTMALTMPAGVQSSIVTAEIITPQATLRILGAWDPLCVASLLKAL